MITQKTYVLKPEDTKKKWYVVDATDKTVGRLATQIAMVLRGKNTPKFTPNADAGDFVIIVNAEKVQFSGTKWDKKQYFWHSGHIGGIKCRSAKEQLERHPELIMYEAVKGMLPKNTLGRKLLTKLKVFKGPNHDHEAQQPVKFEL